MGKQNMAMFGGHRMFNPFQRGQGGPPDQACGQRPTARSPRPFDAARSDAAGPPNDAAIDDLKRKPTSCRPALAELSKKS
jgi:hypothetical protein